METDDALSNNNTIVLAKPLDVSDPSTDTVDQPPTPTIVANNLIEAESIIVPKSGPKASEDVRYKKYFKMLQFGVPAPAVKLKMDADGLDSRLLELG